MSEQNSERGQALRFLQKTASEWDTYGLSASGVTRNRFMVASARFCGCQSSIADAGIIQNVLSHVETYLRSTAADLSRKHGHFAIGSLAGAHDQESVDAVLVWAGILLMWRQAGFVERLLVKQHGLTDAAVGCKDTEAQRQLRSALKLGIKACVAHDSEGTASASANLLTNVLLTETMSPFMAEQPDVDLLKNDVVERLETVAATSQEPISAAAHAALLLMGEQSTIHDFAVTAESSAWLAANALAAHARLTRDQGAHEQQPNGPR